MSVSAGKASIAVGMAGVLAAACFAYTLEAQQPLHGPLSTAAPHVSLVDEYCLSCHDEDHKKGGLELESVAADEVPRHPDVWEKVVRKLRDLSPLYEMAKEGVDLSKVQWAAH